MQIGQGQVSEPRGLSEANKGASERGGGSTRNEPHPNIDKYGATTKKNTKVGK